MDVLEPYNNWSCQQSSNNIQYINKYTILYMKESISIVFSYVIQSVCKY